MSLFIEPGTVTVEVAGESIEVKVLTGRDRIKVSREYLKIGKIVGDKGEDEELERSDVLDVQDANYRILKIGLSVDPDTVNPEHWSTLVGEVWKANTVSEEDAKN